MKILKPTELTDAMLVSTTATPETLPLWNSTTDYAVGAECYLGRVCYRAAAANKDVKPGEETEFPKKWAETRPTNEWAMFDNAVGTSSKATGSLKVVLEPGSTEGIALFELVGRSVDVFRRLPDGMPVYTRTVDLDGRIVESIYDWFFTDFEQLTDVVLTDLPGQFYSGTLEVEIKATGDVAIGVCKPGGLTEIGDTEAGATVGIIDYSVKNTNEFGVTTFLERSYSKRASLSIVTEKRRFNKIFRALAAFRAMPCVYIGTDAQGYEPLLIYGKYRDFSIDVAYPQHHLCSLEIEGMI